jgi:4-hydroxyphenylpyruvate dioxygenase
VGEGELLHAYTAVLPTGFYVELLERRGGYDGYGSAGTHVRLAAQAAQAARSALGAQSTR